jgi:hypothetical protein
MSDVAYQLDSRLPMRYTSLTADANVTLEIEWYEES